MDTFLETLGAEGLLKFQALQPEAIKTVTERFYTTHGTTYQKFGERGREACREDLAFHLEFLRPVLEFGLLQPMVDYLSWLASVLVTRSIPSEHLALSLDWLAEFFTEQMEAADGLVVANALQAARIKFLEAGEEMFISPPAPEAWPEEAAFEAALLSGNQSEARACINTFIDSGQSLIDIELHLIQPALYNIGEKWQTNQVSVAQEHMATAIASSVMTEGLLRSPIHAAIGKKVLLACVESNNHAVGLRMVADAFQLGGWEVQYLGQNVPTVALIRQVMEWKPDLVGLSVSFAHQLKVVKQVIAQLEKNLGSARPAVIIGGLAINRFNTLASLVGADGFGTDSQTAVLSANQLICE